MPPPSYTPPHLTFALHNRMLGSLTNYRRLLRDHVFAPRLANGKADPTYQLSPAGHGVAGIFAGWTVSFIAAPVEHVKARLQIQYSADKSKRLYKGPIDCTRKIYSAHGLKGLYHGLSATLLFRSFFFFWWSTYNIYSTGLRSYTSLSEPAVNFWAGGLSAQMFWITSYPSDVVKQRIMTDSLGADRKYARWKDAAAAIWRDSGWKGYWRGFLPCFLRAFPANAMALLAFEGVMRAMS
jgi:solute carrier family 25 carnitine/acylcarnitine transporter 20/29